MANSKTLHAVIFRIGALICAAPAGIVREILPRLPATRIPGVAEAIEGARFVELESPNHILLQFEPAWPVLVREMRAFLGARDKVAA